MNQKLSIILSIVLIALALLFVSGQQGCQGTEKETFDTGALTMNFVADAPPSQVNYGQTFPIYVDIKNNGGYDIGAASATFYLTGIGDNLRGVTTKLTNDNILVKKTPTSEGGSARLKFAEAATPAVPLQTAFTLNFQLTSCYDYFMLSESAICAGKTSNVCSVEGEKISASRNSASPIQVTSVIERIEGNKLYYDIIIENKGTGKVYLTNTDCEKIQKNDLNEKRKEGMVDIAIKTTEPISCNLQDKAEPYSTISALEGTAKLGKITCVETLPSETHSAPFEVSISYKYVESQTKTLTILPA